MRKHFLPILILFAIYSCKKNSDTVPPVPQPTRILDMLGTDVSYLPELRASGISLYNSSNQVEDALITLKNAGVNTIRLRLWKNPSTPNSDLTSVAQISSQAKQLGLKTCITVHYSSTWADPGTQTKPAVWTGISFSALKDSIFNYTKLVMQTLNPDYIQIGNEINGGLLWPDGHISNLANMKQLLQQGIQAVRQTNNNTKIILHVAGIGNVSWWFAQVQDLDYNIIGLSYYPKFHGKDLDAVRQSIIGLSSTHNRSVAIMETAYPFTLQWNDWTNNIVGLAEQLVPNYNATPEGQKAFVQKIKSILVDIPSSVGFCYWGAEWISYKGNTANDGSSWENQAFWDFNNKALPVMEAYK